MYEFTEDCYIGIPELDEEHRNLFEMLNESIVLMDQPSTDKTTLAKSLLNGLKDYTITHFTHEEDYMKKINDPELPSQEKEHAAFIEKINSFSLENCTDNNAEQIMHEILTFLVRWLYHHILSSDMLIGKFSSEETETIEDTDDFLTFSAKYHTGISSIDEEHKKLFDILRNAYQLTENQLLHDKYDKIMEILNELKEYAETHFQNEEAYMKQIHYSGLEAQHQAHTTFVERLLEVTYNDLDQIDENQQEYLHNLMDFLLIWLTNHILKMDLLIPVEK